MRRIYRSYPVAIAQHQYVALIKTHNQINIQFEYINVHVIILNTIGRRYSTDRLCEVHLHLPRTNFLSK